MLKELTGKLREVGVAETTRLIVKYNFKKLAFIPIFYLVEKPSFFVWRIRNRKKQFTLPCYYPFQYLGIKSNGDCYLCCGGWLPECIGNLKYKSVKAVFNSVRAQRVRMAMYRGSLEYCNTSRCDLVNSKNYKVFDKEFILNFSFITDRTKTEILGRKLKISDGPSRLTDGISSACNVACKFCYTYGNDKRTYDRELIERMKSYIMENIGSLRLLNFCSSGEPFIQKHVKEIIKAVRKNPDVSFYFTTNLNYISEDTKLLLKESNVARIHASINAATKETYEKLVCKGNWNNVMNNLDFFIDMREHKNKDMSIQISMVITKLNYKEIINFAKFGIQKNVKVIIYPMVEEEKNRDLQIREKEILELKEMLADKVFEDSRVETEPFKDFMQKMMNPANCRVK